MARTAFILTALDCECDAVLAHLTDVQEVEHPMVGTVYSVGRFEGWRVAVAEIGAGNTNAAAEAERALAHFSPEVALFVGVAGGIKDVDLGDVVVGTKVYGYHSGKAVDDFQPRPDLGTCSHRLTQKARSVRRSQSWLQRIRTATEDAAPRAVIGPIAAGEQVVASRESETYHFLRQQYGDAVAVEMEGHGFLRAAFAHTDVTVGVVRGVSDLIANKSEADAEGSQARASAHAAAFAFELLSRLKARAEPEWTDEATRDLSTQLDTKLRERDELTHIGADTTEIDQVILGLKREIRKGPERQAGDFIADRYRLIRKIGGGGFATVWEANDRRIDEQVALKLLHGRFATNRQRRDRLFRGARQMVKLEHPHIVRVLNEPGTEDGWHYFTMELLEGDFRAAVLEGRLDLDQRLDVLSQVASALEFAHEQRIVHRDVKPSNILLDSDGVAKLSDFDLVKALDTTGATRTRQGMGSYLYAAPEVMLDATGAGPSCDVYGLAVTALFALLGEDPGGLFIGYRDRYFETIDLPPPVRDVLHRAMAHDPDERFAAPSDFCSALREALASRERAPAETAMPEDPAPSSPRRRIVHEASSGASEDLAQQLERLVDQDDGDGIVALAESALGTTNLKDIWFLDWALRHTSVHDLIPRLYDALPSPTHPDLFRIVATKDSQTELWQTIPAGDGLIGSPPQEQGRHSDEEPRHRVEIKRPFALGAVPTTEAQWAQLDPSKAATDRPVVGVTWWEAITFCRWLEHKLGLAGARLPTEEEWEYACRAGSETRYSSGNLEADLAKVGWYKGNSEGLQPVGQKEANRWGLYDMHGNVREWTASAWKGDYSAQADGLVIDPTEEPADLAAPPRAGRVIRGGGFWDSAGRARSAYRDGGRPGGGSGVRGFRVLLPSPERP